MNKQTYHCSRCGSSDVREIRWTDPNNNEILSEFEGLEGLSDYCNTCGHTIKVLLPGGIMNPNRSTIYEWPESQEHLQCKHSSMLTGSDTIIVPTCVCQLGLHNEGGESCEFYQEIEEPRDDIELLARSSGHTDSIAKLISENFVLKTRSVGISEKRKKDPQKELSNATKQLNEVFSQFGKIFSPEVVKQVPEKCENCSDINTSGSVITCNRMLKLKRFAVIPDVTTIPAWCSKKLTDEECKVIWNDIFPNDPIK